MAPSSSSKVRRGRIRVGIGGWIYAPWRGVFYPDGLAQRRELEYASRHLSTLEINSTYYGAQRPESFARWHDETPEDFVFSLKAPRFAMNRRVLAEAGATIERFLGGGVLNLRGKLGPINWQLTPGKRFDPEDYARFLELLPEQAEGRPLRHALEVRDKSFCTPEFVALARRHKAAIVVSGDSGYPLIADASAPFVYARIMGTAAAHPQGYAPADLDRWAERALAWSRGETPADLATCAAPLAAKTGRDVYLYVISGFKERNPAAAMALIERLGAS
ncbi:DUF72 domain-containing protein [Paraburkholderia lycopersici]|uniref:Uncharacterized conserved protein YecE, DUF72 family n=1 Tax=Paraburkholderia lycopersici TaxID=416944 RepID=A0A1G6RJV7_9BURK|nr:DUF72 domain-containing protein [Paraburkholderia lycopersici]SDD04216.1 Uncharacterized conserved protein YecE, DUF72 family [Paraburkholderia lycopersici]